MSGHGSDHGGHGGGEHHQPVVERAPHREGFLGRLVKDIRNSVDATIGFLTARKLRRSVRSNVKTWWQKSTHRVPALWQAIIGGGGGHHGGHDDHGHAAPAHH